MRIKLYALFLILGPWLLTGCASDRVDFGGVMNPADVPSQSGTCSSENWERVHAPSPDYPEDMMAMIWMMRRDSDDRSMAFRFDVLENGQTANIYFISPRWFIDHAAWRTGVLAGAEAIAKWRYEYIGEGPALYASGCQTSFQFIVED